MYKPFEVAKEVGLAHSTLRWWSNRFASELSEFAGKNPDSDGRSHRRYTEADVHALKIASSCLRQGMSDTQILARLKQLRLERDAEGHDVDPDALRLEIAAKSQTINVLQEEVATLRDALRSAQHVGASFRSLENEAADAVRGEREAKTQLV